MKSVSIARYGGLVVPPPPFQRVDLQEQFIRDMEIDPDRYYPTDYHPQLLEAWPTDPPAVGVECRVVPTKGDPFEKVTMRGSHRGGMMLSSTRPDSQPSFVSRVCASSRCS